MAETQGFKARVEYEVTNGTQLLYTFPFSYLRKKFIKVDVLHADNSITTLTYGVDYVVNDLSLTLTNPAKVGEHLIIYRQTTTDKIITWNDGSILLASDMNTEDVQMLHLQEEQQDYIQSHSINTKTDSATKEVLWDALNHRVINVSDPKDPQDVVTKHYMENVQGGFVAANTKILNDAKDTLSATQQTQSKAQANEELSKAWANSTESPDNADDTQSSTGKTQSSRSWALHSEVKAQESATSEVHAKTSETNAKDSETKAKTSETNAKDSETNAKDSETKAKTSETKAKTSETNAKDSETKARLSEQNAKASETKALSAENSARSHEQSAYNYATTAQSWAESEGSPDGEDDSSSTTGKTKSAKGWAMQAKEYAGSLNLSFIINAVLPVGSIIEFINDTDPNELYQGTTWVKMDAGHVLISAGTYTENGTTYTYSLGDKGGEAKHKSTIDETPSHRHNTTSDGNHTHLIANNHVNGGGDLTAKNYLIKKCTENSYENYELIGSGTAPSIGLTSSSGGHTHSISATGGNQPHENRMPYQVINRWKRIA